MTVSARVRRELWEKLKSYGINISEVIRRSLEEELRRRETKLLKKLAADEVEEIMRAVIALTKFMQVIELEDPVEGLRTSNEIETTFYDVACVVTALRKGLTLVTDDRRLAAKIERNRDITLEEYEGELHVIESADL